MSECLDVFFCGFPASGKSTAWERFVARHHHECTPMAVRVTEEELGASRVNMEEEFGYLTPGQLGWVHNNGEKLYVTRNKFDEMLRRGMFIKDPSASNEKRIDRRTVCRRSTLNPNYWPEAKPHHIYRTAILGPRLVLYFYQKNIMLENAVVFFFTGEEEELKVRLNKRPKDGANATWTHHNEISEQYLAMELEQTFVRTFGEDCIIDSSSLTPTEMDLEIDRKVIDARASLIARRG